MARAGDYAVTSKLGLELDLVNGSLFATPDGGVQQAVGGGGGVFLPFSNGFLVPQDLPGATISQAQSAGQFNGLRFTAPSNLSITKGVLFMVADTASDPIELAIYNSSLTSKLATSGPVVPAEGTTSNGYKTLPLTAPFAITAGTVYYAVLVVTVITTSMSIVSQSVAFATTVGYFGSAVGNLSMIRASSGGIASPLPNDISGVAQTTVNNCPVIALRID